VDGRRLDPIRRGLPDPTEHRRFCDGLLREVASEVIQRELAYDECRSEFPLRGASARLIETVMVPATPATRFDPSTHSGWTDTLDKITERVHKKSRMAAISVKTSVHFSST